MKIYAKFKVLWIGRLQRLRNALSIFPRPWQSLMCKMCQLSCEQVSNGAYKDAARP